MNGRKAKELRRMATKMCEKLGTPLGKGYNEYHQAMNTFKMVKDVVDGIHVVKPEKAPGTVTRAWEWRNTYQTLKRNYLARRRKGLA